MKNGIQKNIHAGRKWVLLLNFNFGPKYSLLSTTTVGQEIFPAWMDFKKTISVTHRKEAIKVAYQLSQPGDVVLIAGKGHENYQEVKGEKLPFDDYKIAQEIFTKTS